jgi:hypothetical protein
LQSNLHQIKGYDDDSFCTTTLSAFVSYLNYAIQLDRSLQLQSAYPAATPVNTGKALCQTGEMEPSAE